MDIILQMAHVPYRHTVACGHLFMIKGLETRFGETYGSSLFVGKDAGINIEGYLMGAKPSKDIEYKRIVHPTVEQIVELAKPHMKSADLNVFKESLKKHYLHA